MTIARTHRDDGFTMVELMAVVAILGILVAIALATYALSTSNARAVTCQQKQRSFQEAVNIYTADELRSPDDIEDLRPYMHDFDGAIKCPVGNAELVYNPVTHHVSCPNHP